MLRMSDATGLKLGQKVPDFQINAFDPTAHGFTTFKLSKNMADKRWTILFFYPADFTFV
jgi:peroxiredoxin (alkyl hydroperoxide reductase subunit C)